MFDKNIYKVELLSIKPDIKVYSDKRMTDNIRDAETEVVAQLIVRRTMWSDEFREVLTNIKIPVYYINFPDIYTRSPLMAAHVPPKSPVFIKVEQVLSYERIIQSDNLQKASVDDLKQYAFDHIDVDGYARKIKDYFVRGKSYYDKAKAQNIVSEEKQIKSWLKTIKRCKKI